MDYLDVSEAREKKGLRLVLTAGVPGPWGEAAKGVFHVKKIPYLAVRQLGGETNDELRAWTGFDNAPQAVYEDEPARIGWSDILFLAERLEPTPSLIPADPEQRAAMWGVLHEIGSEMGFAWCRRLQLLHPMMQLPGGQVPESIARLAGKYGYSAETITQADRRVVEILDLLTRRLTAQRERGSDFLIGDALSAADIYWATFAAMIEPLPALQCAMPEMLRTAYTLSEPRGLAAADPILLEHRDRIYQDYLGLPLDF